jgi:Uncharacterized protein family UPF0029/RWD domain
MSYHRATTLNEDLSEEIEAVNAIYGTDVIIHLSSPDVTKSSADKILLRPPTQSISFLLSFNHDYPSSCPHVNGTQSTGQLAKGEGHHAVSLLQETLRKVWTPGAVCLFDLIEEVGPLLQDGTIYSSEQAAAEKSDTHLPKDSAALTEREAEAIVTSHVVPNWFISEAITEKKSIFVARCARITNKAEATSFLTDLLSTNKKVAAATHNITAWRIHNADTGVTIQDCDDDGETAAGGRLLHLMQLMDVWNVVVVVTRWYGGVKLGPDRFRLINQAARDALVKGEFVKTEDGKPVMKRGKK